MKRSTNTAHKEAQLFALEGYLADALKPITPPSDLVLRMREQIRFPQRQEIVFRLGGWKRLFLIYGGVMSGFLVTITVARALFYFLSKR